MRLPGSLCRGVLLLERRGENSDLPWERLLGPISLFVGYLGVLRTNSYCCGRQETREGTLTGGLTTEDLKGTALQWRAE